MLCHYADCHYAGCHILLSIMLYVIMLSAIMLNVVMQSVIKLCVVAPSFQLRRFLSLQKNKKGLGFPTEILPNLLWQQT